MGQNATVSVWLLTHNIIATALPNLLYISFAKAYTDLTLHAHFFFGKGEDLI